MTEQYPSNPQEFEPGYAEPVTAEDIAEGEQQAQLDKGKLLGEGDFEKLGGNAAFIAMARAALEKTRDTRPRP